MSDNKNIYEALAKAQSKFDCVKKDAANPFFKSKYASIPSILSACREALAENGLCITQPIVFENGLIIVRTILAHKSGEKIVSDFPLPPINVNSKNDLQDQGKAITYLRRYALQAILNIAGEDDDDDGNNYSKHQKAARENQTTSISKEQAKHIDHLIGEDDQYRTQVLKYMLEQYGIKNLYAMPISLYEKIKPVAQRKYNERNGISNNEVEVA